MSRLDRKREGDEKHRSWSRQKLWGISQLFAMLTLEMLEGRFRVISRNFEFPSSNRFAVRDRAYNVPLNDTWIAIESFRVYS
jgi:hypothetical protein